MAYRNGTYVAFDGRGTTNPTESDMKYYAILQSWNKNSKYDFSFSDSHKKTYRVLDDSSIDTLKGRLLERMRNSKNMVLIISGETNYDRGMLNFEIEKAVDYYELPLVVTYPGYNYIMAPEKLRELWPKALLQRIDDGSVRAIHIPFREKCLTSAIEQFSVLDAYPQGTLSHYTEETYRRWGYV